MELKHIGIIPDGNRRWAVRNNLPIISGYLKGVEKFYEILEWILKNTEIKEISFYILSYENFVKRSREEIKFILDILNRELDDLINRRKKLYEVLENTKTKVRFIGLLNLFPKEIVEKMEKVMKDTEKNNNRILNLLVCYSGRQEIINAIKKIKDYEILDEENFRKYLWIENDVDLIIRTGGFSRLSNFLVYQSSYSEIVVIEKLWPDITVDDVKNAINTYYNIIRKFGR